MAVDPLAFEWRVEGKAHRLYSGAEYIGSVEPDPRGLSWSLQRSFTSGVQHFGACPSYADGRARVENAAIDVIKSRTASSLIIWPEDAP